MPQDDGGVLGGQEDPVERLQVESGKCQHFYFYHLHRDFGVMHLRLQSWFPFQVQVCLNGHEWLSRQMDRHQMDYAQKENCFTWVSHLKGANGLYAPPRLFQLQKTGDLSAASWQNVGAPTAEASAQVDATDPAEFFRLQTEQDAQ